MAFESGSSSRTTIPGSCAQPSFRKHACGSQLPHCMIILPSAFGPCMSCITHITHQPNALPQISTTSGCNIPGTMGLLNSSGRTSTIALLSKRPPTKLTSRQQKKLASGKPGTFASHSQSTIFDSLLQMPALKLGTKRCPGKQPRQACSSALGWIQSLQNLICTASLPSLPPLRLLLTVRPLSRQLPLPETSCVASLPSTQWKGFSHSPTSTSSTFAP